MLRPGDLDQLVSRVALYPDPLLAQVPTASTYLSEIPEAPSGRTGTTISEDSLTWDASVLALLPFPSVLDMMDANPSWTAQLDAAVLGQRSDVMDAVQRMPCSYSDSRSD
jgi:hypothetical protein